MPQNIQIIVIPNWVRGGGVVNIEEEKKKLNESHHTPFKTSTKEAQNL